MGQISQGNNGLLKSTVINTCVHLNLNVYISENAAKFTFD